MSKTDLVSIIDDDASVRAGMEALVNSIGFTACVFDSAEQFLRSSRIEETSCLVTDVQMPGMNGLELQSRLVAQGRPAGSADRGCHSEIRSAASPAP